MLPNSAQPPTVIDLAREPPFRLGAVDVRPTSLELCRGDRRISLEPRIMQVLVVLAQADGGVVSRAELVERCWNGRIVGDNAINRVLSHVRKLAAGIGHGSFTLETITTIGYRLVAADAGVSSPAAQLPGTGLGESVLDGAAPLAGEAAGPAPPTSTHVDRRLLLGTAALASVAGLAWWQLAAPARPPVPAAKTLYDKGLEAQIQARREQGLQAAAYFREAIRLDSRYADAWGALALCHATQLEHGGTRTEQAALAARSRSAAARALALEPGNMDAEVALVVMRPPFRNWLRLERDARAALARHPDHRRLNGIIGRVYCDVGRWADGAEQFTRLVHSQPYLPVMQGQLAAALWGAGRLEEAEQTLERAVALWPDHPATRLAQRDFLALTGRPEIALAQLDANRVASPATELLAGIYAALRSASPVDTGRQAGKLRAAVVAGHFDTAFALPYLLALGGTGDVFPLLDSYYFGSAGGPAGVHAPPGPWSRRETEMLFRPIAAPLWRDPRFFDLTRRIGLDAYWHATGVLPDFRRRGRA